MKYNEEVAYDLGLSLEDLYVLQKIEDKIILDKLKNCSLYCWTNDSAQKVSSIYDSLFIEIEHDNKKFF